jgi:hypothetical protein
MSPAVGTNIPFFEGNFTERIFAGTKGIFLSTPHVSEGSVREQRVRARDEHLAVRSNV